MASVLFASRSLREKIDFDPSRRDVYVFDIVPCATDPKESLLAVSGSTNYINVYENEALQLVTQIPVEQKIPDGRISKLCYSNGQLWCSCTDGTIRSWDPRSSQKPVCILQGYNSEPFNCITTSHAGDLLVGSTDKVGEDACIYIWDVRTGREPIAHFTDSHSDDITHVLFNPTRHNHMASGSTDGLVCLYDLTTLIEEDATLSVKNSDSSVATVGYFGPSSEYVYCLTHQETFHVWNSTEVEPIAVQDNIREDMAEQFGMGHHSYYLVDCHYDLPTQRLFLIAGDHSGGVHVLHANLSKMLPVGLMTGGHSSTVRAVYWSDHNDCIFTGGEDGVLCVWKPAR